MDGEVPAMGDVDRTTGGTTELRVHGVSGTPPEATLDHPHTERVAGDADAGFYRRVWESAACAQDRPPGGDGGDAEDGRQVDRLEAYSWGGLTSGGWSRALYLLLLPFLLLNVGFFATPGTPAKEGESPGALRRTSELLQRLLALSLTMTMVLAMIEVSVDVVGWQCGRATATCGTGPLGVPDWSWLREPGPRLAASALVPIGVILVLWWLARRTWASAEAVAPPKAAATPGVQVSPLEDRRFWNGGEAVANLRASHISAALALVGVAVAAPAIVAPGGGISAFWSSGPVVQRVVAMVLVVVLVASVVGVATWNLAERRAPDADADADATPPQPVGGWRTALPTATLALALVAAVATATVGSPPAVRPASILPWLTWAINAVFWSQVALVALFAVITAVQARSLPRPAPVALTTSGSGGAVVTSPAWRGLAAPVFALLGWIVGSGFAAALALRIAD